MKTFIILLIVLSANFATAGELEYDVSNSAWYGVVVSGTGSPKVYGYISRKWSKVRNNAVENPVVVTGSFYGKGNGTCNRHSRKWNSCQRNSYHNKYAQSKRLILISKEVILGFTHGTRR